MAVFDATVLLCFLEPDAGVPIDPYTNSPISNAKARIDHLIATLESRRETIVIPTPALSEVLVHAGEAGPQYLSILTSSRCFRVEAFDERAAIELAAMTREAIATGDLRAGLDITRAKLKFDRQIIATARIHSEATIYSDDRDVASLGRTFDIEVVPIRDLPLPPEDPQKEFDFD